MSTHHALLTQPEELLNLLGQEKLCAAHGTADFLQDWRAKGDGEGNDASPSSASRKSAWDDSDPSCYLAPSIRLLRPLSIPYAQDTNKQFLPHFTKKTDSPDTDVSSII